MGAKPRVAAERQRVTKHEWLRGEVFRRGANGAFELHEAPAGERLTLASISAAIDVCEIYRDPLSP